MRALQALLPFLVLVPVLAQSDRGAITGRVTDPTSAAIPNTSVTATNSATGVRYTAASTDEGNYLIPQLPIGRYDVAAEAAGFRRSVQTGVTVNVAQTVTLNIELQVGQVEQSVEVSAQAAVVESTTSDVGTVVDSRRIIDLPLPVAGNQRNPEAFIFLTPGVPPALGNPNSPNDVQINGSQSRAKEVLLDGVGSTSPESGGILFTYPSVEAIAEFKLVGSNFSAQYGRTGGGVEVFATRSGTNELHGSVFEYFRNDKLDARGFFARTRPINRQNEYGVAVGGPVVIPKLYDGRNKTFFHFVWSGFRFRAGQVNQLVTLPNEAFQRGDFSALLNRPTPIRIYDPATTRANPAGGFLRDPFPGNIIPQDRFSAVSRRILPLLPATTGALTNNFLTVGAQTFDRDQYDIKFDQNFSDRHKLSVFTYLNQQLQVDAERLPGALSPALARNRPGRWVRLNDDIVISPNTLNNFIFGFTREPEIFRRLTSDQGIPTQIGLQGVNTGEGNTFPLLTFTDGFEALGNEVKNVGQQANNTFQVNDTVSHVRGNHSFKFGVEARWLQTNGADPNLSQGRFRFSSLETSDATTAGRATSGNGFASFLLGAVDSADTNVLLVVPGNRYRYLAGFVQDDWRVTQRLTLNLGFRYDLFFPRQEAFDNLSSFDPTLPNPRAGGRLGALAFLGEGTGRNGRSSFADTYYKNFGPRVGYAYTLTPKTVLRGGFGVYYAPGNATAGLRSSQSFSLGFNAQPVFQSLDNGVTPAFNWDAGFPQNFARPPFIDPSFANGSAVNAILRSDGRPPYFLNSTFSVQRELPGEVLLEAAYVGIKGTRLGTGLIDLNELDPRFLSLGTLLQQNINSAAAREANIPIPFAGFSGTVAQALRPYPQYLSVANRSNPNGNSTYHSLQVKAERRFRNGFTFLTAYTWSKSLSDGDVQAGGGPQGQTFYNRRLEKSLSTNDVPHVLALSYLYELPFGPGKRFLSGGGVLGKLVGGWQVNAIHQYASGRPVALAATNTLPLFNGVLRPDAVIGQEKRFDYGDRFDPATELYINPAAFARPQGLRFGTAARTYGDLRGVPYANENVGLIKRTPITEQVTLTFRAEFFNLLNRTVFGLPDGNVSNASFGRVSSQLNTPRQGQLALRVDF